MKRKHYIILMITFVFVIVACVFLSQTIQSIVSPKAEFIKPSKRNISVQYQLSGYFAMPDREERYLDPDQGGPVTITNILATKGLPVVKDQLLFEAEVSEDVLAQRDALETKLDQLLQNKATLYKSLVEADVDLDSRAVRLVADYTELNKSFLFMEEDSQEYKDAKKKLDAMESEMQQLYAPDEAGKYQLMFQWRNLLDQIDAMVSEIKQNPSQKKTLESQLDALLQQKITLYDTMLAQEVDPGAPAMQLIDDYLNLQKALLLVNKHNRDYPAMQERLPAMESQINELLSEGQDEPYDLIFSWYGLLDDIDEAARGIAEYDAMVEALSACVAPYDGIITDVYGRLDQVYTGDQPLYAISASGELGVAADVTRSDPVAYNSTHLFQCLYQGGYYSCDYVSVEEDKDAGTKTLYIKARDPLIGENENPLRYLNEAVTVYSYTGAVTCEYVLPSSAVIEMDDDEYIYIAKKEKDFWGERYKARLAEVDVVITAGGYSGIGGMLYLDHGEYVLNNWNKNIEDGERVMEYGD